MMCQAKKLSEFANEFRNRLDDQSILFVHDYENHNEPALALQLMCDYLGEQDVRITAEEYAVLIAFGHEFGVDVSSDRFDFLLNLIEEIDGRSASSQ